MTATAFARLPLSKMVNSCVKKKAYGKRQSAKRASLMIRRKHNYNMGIYRCPCCKRWHLYSIKENGST